VQVAGAFFLVSAFEVYGVCSLPLPIEELLVWLWQRWELEVAHRQVMTQILVSQVDYIELVKKRVYSEYWILLHSLVALGAASALVKWSADVQKVPKISINFPSQRISAGNNGEIPNYGSYVLLTAFLFQTYFGRDSASCHSRLGGN
jgi:hypothetical protein